MPIERRIVIRINAVAPIPAVIFDPDPLVADTADQIFWANEDDEPHWPGRPNDDGTINTTFYMHNQIAAGHTSDIFTPTHGGPLRYKCSLHEDEHGSLDIREV